MRLVSWDLHNNFHEIANANMASTLMTPVLMRMNVRWCQVDTPIDVTYICLGLPTLFVNIQPNKCFISGTRLTSIMRASCALCATLRKQGCSCCYDEIVNFRHCFFRWHRKHWQLVQNRWKNFCVKPALPHVVSQGSLIVVLFFLTLQERYNLRHLSIVHNPAQQMTG